MLFSADADCPLTEFEKFSLYYLLMSLALERCASKRLEIHDIFKARKRATSRIQPPRYTAAHSRRRIRNTNLSETSAATCHLHVFPRPGLDGVGALGKIFGNFRRRAFRVLSTTVWYRICLLFTAVSNERQLSVR